MKYIFLFSTSTLTGQAAQSYNLLKYLVKNGHNVWAIIDLNREGNLRDYIIKSGAKVINSVSISNKNKLISKYKEINGLKSIIMDLKPDFLVSSFSNDHFSAVLANSKLDFKARVIRFFHSNKVRTDFIHKNLYQKTDIFIFYDLSIYSDFKNKYFSMGNKLYLLSPCIDTKFFTFKNKNEARKLFGINENTFVVGYTGMFQKGRMHKELIDVFYEYRKIDSESKLMMIGGGETLNSIKRYAKKRLGDNVIFTGFISDEELVDAYNSMDIFLLLRGGHDSSLRMLYEAQSCGTYILAYNSFPAKRLIEVTNYGNLLLDKNDKSGICNLIHIAKNNIGDSIRDDIHSKVDKEFSIEKVGQSFEKICKNIL